MKKTIRILAAVVMMMMLLSSAVAFAEPSAHEMRTLRLMVNSANSTIKSMVKVAQATPYNDVPWLLAAVNCTVAPVFAYARRIGATVVCEYDYYVIDGQTVAVDPLKVINGTRVEH